MNNIIYYIIHIIYEDALGRCKHRIWGAGHHYCFGSSWIFL